MLYSHLAIRSWFYNSFGITFILLISFLGAGSAEAQSWENIGTFPGYICLAKFLDANTGFVGLGLDPGYPLNGPVGLYKTTNGGKTWTQASIPSGYGGEIGDLMMVDSLNGWIAMTAYGGSGNKALWRTTDAGLTWNETQLAGSGTSLAITPSRMIVTDIFSLGHTSTDGGNTFTDQSYSSTNCVNFVDALHGVITDYRGENWLNSSDGGLTWQNSSMNVECWSVYPDTGTPNFYTAPEGPTDGSPRHLIIYHSTDYGNTWGQLANFPFVSTGHLTGLGDQYLFFQVQDVQNTISGVTYNGFYYSTDQGVSWTSIGGPSAHSDARFTVLNECSGPTIFGFDDKESGSVFRYTFGSGNNSPAMLALPEVSQNFVKGTCSQPVDTAILMSITGCLPGSATIDSLWLTGSSAFTITDSRTSPRPLSAIDSILISYTGTQGPDTGILHIQYNLGSGLRDTSVMLAGSLSNSFLSAQLSLHREVGVSYFGSPDSLALGVDIGSSINIDSLWPYVQDISGTIEFDSSVVSYAAYLPPQGWVLTSFQDRGNAVDFTIHNASSKTPGQPLNLGTAVFMPTYPQLATSDVNLTNFIMEIGKQALAPCVTEDEDQHWSVKVLVTDGVSEAENSTQQNSLAVYPNPAGDELFVQNLNSEPVKITFYDAIGRIVLSANAASNTTTTLSLDGLPNGSYVLVGRIGDNIVTKQVSKIR